VSRALYGGTSADVLVRLVEVRPGTTVLGVAGGVPLDVRRADTAVTVTDVVAAPGYAGAAFTTGRARTDAAGGIAFLGPDGLTVPLEVRAAAIPGAAAGAWTRLTGQPAGASTGGGTGTPVDSTGLVTLADLNGRGYQTATQVDARVQALVGAAPAALDTLVELARALNNDANFATTVAAALAARVLRADYDTDLGAVRAAIAQLVTRADTAEAGLAAAERRITTLEQAEPVPPDTSDAFTDVHSDAF